MKQNTSVLLRNRLKDLRSQISPEQQEREGLLLRARLFTWLANTQDAARDSGQVIPNIVAAYWPLADEPDLRPLMRQWDLNEVIVTLPVMLGIARPLAFHQWDVETELFQGQFGVMEPPARNPFIPDVVLVPTLGFTAQGDRIGYGKGFYDRTLADLRQAGQHPITIGIAWREGAIEELEPEYQAQPHDFRLDAILTPDGWVSHPPEQSVN